MPIGLLLTGFGLFGIAWYATRQRIREISIRKVHGATRGQIIWLLNKPFCLYAAVAYVLAMPVAWWLMQRWLEQFAYRAPLSVGIFVWPLVVVWGVSALIVCLQGWMLSRVINNEYMKALLLSIRTILRFRTYTAINVLGLALSLGCVFVLVRYIHQERTVNHFVPEADRTFLTAVFKEGEPRGSLGESGDRNNDPNYRNPLDHPAVEAFSRFMMFDDDFVTKDDYRYAVNTIVVDSLFFDLIPYGCKEGSLQLKPDEALLTPQAALRIFGTEHAVGKELVTSSGKPVRVAGILKEPSTKSSFQFDVVLSVYLMKDWSRVAYEVVRLHRPEDGDEINRANRTWTTGRLLPARPAQGLLPEQGGICLCRLGNTGPFGRAPTARTGGGADSAGRPAQLHEPLFGGDAEARTRTGHEEGTGSRQGTNLPPALCGECLPERGGRLSGLATGGGDTAVGGRVVRHSRTG